MAGYKFPNFRYKKVGMNDQIKINTITPGPSLVALKKGFIAGEGFNSKPRRIIMAGAGGQ